MASTAIKHPPMNVTHILKDMKTKGDMKNTAIKTATQVGIGVVGGGILSAIIGKPSFLIGLTLAGIGNYNDNSWLAPLGIGMMASSHIAPNTSESSVSGFDLKEQGEKIKERLAALKDSFMSKTYMDKIFKGKPTATKGSEANTRKSFSEEIPETEEITNGFGNLTQSENTLNQIEQQLVASAMEFQRSRGNRQTQGVDAELMGMEGDVDFSRF